MAWSGKLVGGLIGGMLGGPLGAGLGATMGHVLGDSSRALELQRLDWQHHGFGDSGPGLVLTPVWTARKLLGVDIKVRVKVGDTVHRATVTPDDPDETCAAPQVFVPYAELGDEDATDVFVRVRAEPGRSDEATFRVRLPNRVRRLGSSGPARAVMALVACARAGGRTFTREDARFIRESFVEGLALDEDGLAWLRAWIRELAGADLARLDPGKVAARLDPHLDAEGRARLIGWLWRGVAEAWSGEAQRAYVIGLAAALGTAAEGASAHPDPRLEAWATLGVAPGTSGDSLREAWLRLVQTWHPDRARTPEEAMINNRRMAEVNAAYRSLQN